MKMDKLLHFGKEIISICEENGVTPIIYGSYLFCHYTKDKNVSPHDIDFYVPRGFNEKMIKIFEKNGIKYKYLKEWHCLILLRGDLKVDLGEINFLYKGPKNFVNFNFDGMPIKALSLKGLISIYKDSIKLSNEPEKYRIKYEKLKQIQK
jgi:hypothetical protein